MKQKVWNIVSSLLILSLLIGNVVQFSVARNGGDKLDQLAKLIDEKFIGEADPEKLGDAAAAAMVAATGDRWSFYTPASEAQNFREQMDNEYVGVGITIRLDEESQSFLILQVNPDGPAREAGIQPGDLLVEVEGQRTSEITIDECRNLVRGPKGTTVALTVLREGQEIAMEVERRSIQTVVAEGRMVTEDIGLVTILNFDTRSSEETIAAIEELRSQGAEKFIFDVRFNPGGFVHELVKTLDYLLPEGDLIRTEDYRGREQLDRSDADHLDLPMAVLVNQDSYSAAEFFAAAMQEYDAAEIIGTHTSGKGYFQITYWLKDGSSVNLSSGKYYTPKGNCLQDVGIEPDVEVTVDEETDLMILSQMIEDSEDPQLQAAIQALENSPRQLSVQPSDAA